MSTTLLYNMFGIRGYEYQRTDYHQGAASFVIWDARGHAFQEHEREATNLAIALTEQTARYVQAVDQAITEVESWATESDLRTADTFNRLMRSPEVRRRLQQPAVCP